MRNKNIPKGLVAGYLVSILLVPLYVQMYPVWRVFNEALSDRVMQVLPVAVTLVLLGLVLLVLRKLQRQENRTVQTQVILLGITLCLAALFVPDPQVPAKRVHVAEYVVLSLVVRYAMSHRMQGIALLFFSGAFATLLGVHDEFLQGLHPSRTYGLRDMSVNALGSFGGALIWYGMGLFGGNTESSKRAAPLHGESLFYLLWLGLSGLAMAWPMAYYRAAALPLWPAAPLAGGMVFFLLSRNHFFAPWKHGMTAVSLAGFSLVLYPLAAGLWSLDFY
jgi:hypothetical membrane protein